MTVTTRIRQLSLALLSALAFFGVTALPGSTLAQEDEMRGRSPGFRTDFGFYIFGGGNSCGGGGCDTDGISEIKWGTHLGVAAGILVRPYRFFSMGMDFSFTNLVPTEDSPSLKRFFDVTIMPTLNIHIPVRFRTVVLEPTFGVGFGLVNGYLTYDGVHTTSRKTSRRYYGPGVSGLFGLNVFVIPEFGFGLGVRINGTFYQQNCDKYEDGEIFCKGYKDSNDNYTSEETGGIGPEPLKAPLKIFYGLHLIYYV